MAVQIQTRYSLEEYFELEYNSTTRHEYINGKIIPMAYTSRPHGTIVHNIDRLLGNCLLDSPVKIYGGDRMVYVPDCNKVYYPDLIILLEYAESYAYKGKMEAELQAIVLIEVLSDSTEDNDRDEKWHCYRKIESLQQYVLISQKRKEIELFNRQPAPNNWQYSAYEEEEETLEIAGCTIKLKDIYHKVALPEPQTASDEMSEIS